MSWTKTRSQLALAVRHGADEATIIDLRRDLRAERLADHIEQQVAAWPPLTAEQRDRLALLLRPSASPSAGDAA